MVSRQGIPFINAMLNEMLKVYEYMDWTGSAVRMVKRLWIWGGPDPREVMEYPLSRRPGNDLASSKYDGMVMDHGPNRAAWEVWSAVESTRLPYLRVRCYSSVGGVKNQSGTDSVRKSARNAQQPVGKDCLACLCPGQPESEPHSDGLV